MMEPLAPYTNLPDPQITYAAPQVAAEGQGQLRVGTYNLAGANDHHNSTGQIADTATTLSEQVVNGKLDVVALQEVGAYTTDARDKLPGDLKDYNEYVLAKISAEEMGLKPPLVFKREETEDSYGNPIVVITGRQLLPLSNDSPISKVTISNEYYTADGKVAPTPVRLGHWTINQPDITIYNADIQSPDGLKNYTIAFGASGLRDTGSFGNSVLLGPDASLQRDANGKAIVEVHDLGADDPSSHENRTALQVDIDVAGKQATVYTAHLTYDKDAEGAKAARAVQYQELARLAEASGDNTLLLGDFNDPDQKPGNIGPLSGETYDENQIDTSVATTDELYKNWFFRAILGSDLHYDENIDRLYVSGDVTASNRKKFYEQGGSDHDLVTWNVDLDQAQPGPPVPRPNPRTRDLL